MTAKRMARETLSHARVACEGPRPTVNGAVPATVARGPVPRERFRLCRAGALGNFHMRRRAGFSAIAAWRGTGPRPTVNGAVPDTVARGPVPRDRWVARAMARDRPSPYDEGGPSAAAAPVGAPPYCIETGRSLLPRRRGSRLLPKRDKYRNGVMKHPQVSAHQVDYIFHQPNAGKCPYSENRSRCGRLKQVRGVQAITAPHSYHIVQSAPGYVPDLRFQLS